MLVTMKNAIFWDVRTDILEEALSSSEMTVLQEPHCVTSQKTHSSQLTSYLASMKITLMSTAFLKLIILYIYIYIYISSFHFHSIFIKPNI
jgi:hypothetical protein